MQVPGGFCRKYDSPSRHFEAEIGKTATPAEIAVLIGGKNKACRGTWAAF
jgi:hypothetical protein